MRDPATAEECAVVIVRLAPLQFSFKHLKINRT